MIPKYISFNNLTELGIQIAVAVFSVISLSVVFKHSAFMDLKAIAYEFIQNKVKGY